MGEAKHREPAIWPRVKTAISFLIEQKADLALAAAAAGMTVRELRRQMAKPHVRRFALEQRQLALEAFCMGSPAALTKVRDESENGMAVVASIKAGEQLRVGAIEDEAAAQKRGPGLQIVILQPGGAREMVPMSPQPMVPMIDGTSVPEPEPARLVPDDPDADVR
jgi:hypothetical protein